MRLISILLPDLRGGGAERVNLDLAHEFSRKGHKIEIVLMQARGELLAEAQAAFSVIDLECPRARKLPFVLLRYLRQHRPDALLASMWPLTVIAPMMRPLGYNGRIVVSEHNTLSVQYNDWGLGHHAALRGSMAISYRLAHVRTGVSTGVVNDIVELSGLSRRMFQVVHNPVPIRLTPNVKALRTIDTLWSTPSGARIVSVGSLKAQKNYPLLFRAFAEIDRLDARLMLVGKGDGEAELRALAVDLGIADRVIFAGFHSDPTPFYHTADLFVLSSNHEGLPTVLIEALATGTPVVSTDCPSGPREILENGKHGRLVPMGDAQALADAIKTALETSHDAAALKRRASDFRPEVAAEQYLSLITREKV
ncbi:glycosyltransferase [Amylibacter sp.]|nr:glycosyltransferase [Amylibacter sp.]